MKSGLVVQRLTPLALEKLWGQRVHNLSRQPVHCLTVLMVKEFFLLLSWNFSWFSFCLLPLVLPPCTTVLLFFPTFMPYFPFHLPNLFFFFSLAITLPIKISLLFWFPLPLLTLKLLFPWKPPLPNTCLPFTLSFFPAVSDYGVTLPILHHI